MRERNKILKMITLISQIGITMLSSIFLCGLIGYLIDQRFGTHTFIVALILGIAGGYVAVFNIVKHFIHAKPESEEGKNPEVIKTEQVLNDRIQELQRELYNKDADSNK